MPYGSCWEGAGTSTAAAPLGEHRKASHHHRQPVFSSTPSGVPSTSGVPSKWSKGGKIGNCEGGCIADHSESGRGVLQRGGVCCDGHSENCSTLRSSVELVNWLPLDPAGAHVTRAERERSVVTCNTKVRLHNTSRTIVRLLHTDGEPLTLPPRTTLAHSQAYA